MRTLLQRAWPLPAALALLLATAAVRAGEPERAADGPGAAAKDQDAERAAKDAELRLKVLDAARRVFLKVVITPRWDEDCVLESLGRNEYPGAGGWNHPGRIAAARLDSLMETFLSRRTIVAPGVLLDKGLVAIEDDGTGWEWKLIGKIEAVDASGRRWPAKVARLMTRTSAFAFQLEGENLPEPPAWRRDFKLGSGERVLTAGLSPDPADPERWFVSAGGALLPFGPGPAAEEKLTFAGRARGDLAPGGSGPGVIFDAAARPAGVTFEGIRLDNAAPAAWQPGAMVESGSIAWGEVDKAQARASAEALRLCYKVRFEFRVDKEDEEEGGGSGRYRSYSSMRGEGGGQDAELFGVSVGAGRLLIPQMLDVGSLRMLDKVTVKVGEEWRPAAFMGAFRDLVGMIVEVKDQDGKLNEPAGLFETKGVVAMTPFIYCQAEEVLGKVRAEARSVRYLSMRRGHGDRPRPVANFLPQGALLFDMEGKLAGMAVSERPAPNLFRMAGRGSRYDDGQSELNLGGFGEHKALLTEPAKGFDPAWRPMTRQEQRRLCWLGVEFEPMGDELAKRLGCSEETRGGQMGLIVSTVYPESPAAKLGIKAQDVLLRLKVEGLGEPLPLLARYAGSSDGWGRPSYMGRMGGMIGMGGMSRTWKARSNFLTRLLTEAGPGRKAEITYLVSGGKKEIKTGAFELAWAPEDYDSAERWKDAKLGLAVKPITYEVREALGLKPEDAGVVISWVEQGSSAQVARLAPYMLILGVEGRPVRTTAEFKKAVEEARGQKKESVRMQVSQMGNSRFADLKLGE